MQFTSFQFAFTSQAAIYAAIHSGNAHLRRISPLWGRIARPRRGATTPGQGGPPLPPLPRNFSGAINFPGNTFAKATAAF